MAEEGKNGDSRRGYVPKPKTARDSQTREKLFLAEQAAEGKIKVLPGDKWAWHYPALGAERAKTIQGLLDGKIKPEQAAESLRPDTLIYDIKDLEKGGLAAVSGRVKSLSARTEQFDYKRFAKFISEMKGRDVTPDLVEELYSGIIEARIQKKMHEAFGTTGKRQMETAMRNETQDILSRMESLPRLQKVLSALKLDWLCEKMGQIGTEKRDAAVAKLSAEERALFKKLAPLYRDYIQNGGEKDYQELVKQIKDSVGQMQAPSPEEAGEESSQEMQELDKELEQFIDQAGMPGTPDDPGIPPEDSDEYHTSPPAEQGESEEKAKSKPFFEIEPPLGGYYCSGRKSYFDVNSKTWSKKKQLSAYSGAVGSRKRHTISGNLESGIKSLPLPAHYALDAGSSKYHGAKPEIFRDQNGCFYLKCSGAGSFSIEFGEEDAPFNSQPIKEDLENLYKGQLSVGTEEMIKRMSAGTPLQKAEQARQYILANHFYPGGGDLHKAQALQYKLRSESTGDNYLQNLDQSEYLECYSANTLFISMMRKAGVPARLVIGYRVRGSKGGKSGIKSSDGHAWSEIWDGQEWRRFDATPNSKPEDKKKDEEKEESQPAEEADDGGVENSNQQPQEGKGQEKGGEQMEEASDSEVSESEKNLDEAQELNEQMNKAKQEMAEKISEAQKFQDLEKLEKEIEESELFEEIKEELEEKIEAKEEQMKEEIKEEVDKMADDGFVDEETHDKIEKMLEEEKAELLDQLKKQIEKENTLYDAYENIKEEMMPLVDQWYKYFVERLPREPEMDVDEYSHNRQGIYDRKAVMKPRNLLFGTIKNPRYFHESFRPRFLASIMVDVSGSMGMGGDKLESARKLLVFFCELFTRISKEFGYIRFSINTFSDSVTEIKRFEHDYDSPKCESFSDNTQSTVKVRLMKNINASGGTNMLEAIKKAAVDLNQESADYPEHASAFYFLGDGGDTCGNAENIRQFLALNDQDHGFGDHMLSAIMLGDESQRQELANIFGDDNTTVAPGFDQLVEKSMEKFEEDIELYLRNKVSQQE